MKKIICFLTFFCIAFVYTSAQNQDSIQTYKKKVLDHTEVDFLMSLYNQDGDRSAVGGGVGTEELTDFTPTIVISLPLNDDDVLTIDAGVSAYTSASSSNINPFNNTGASKHGDDDKNDDDNFESGTDTQTTGTPWLASSGASKSDVLTALHVNYSHSSNNRNFIWGANIGLSNEYDYTSVGFGGNITRLFNEKNTEIGISGMVYLDKWRPIYPTELDEYDTYGNDFLLNGYFQGVTVLNQSGAETVDYLPSNFTEITKRSRNSYSASFFVSQILTQRLQAALFFDLVKQNGLLSTPYHRMYFSDKANYYIGEASDIPIYTTSQNTGVFQLADDIERLPSSRFKIPIGARLNYYISETLALRSYYRYYTDDWDLNAHTFNLDLPIRFNPRFSFTPSFRYYTQQAAKFYAPYETHVSTEQYYTSDADLATFNSKQYSGAINYNDLFNDIHIRRLRLKSANIKYSHYSRSDKLKANIVSIGFKFIVE